MSYVRRMSMGDVVVHDHRKGSATGLAAVWNRMAGQVATAISAPQAAPVPAAPAPAPPATPAPAPVTPKPPVSSGGGGGGGGGAVPQAPPRPTIPATSQQAPDDVSSSGGIPMGTVLLLGGAALGAYLLFRRSS